MDTICNAHMYSNFKVCVSEMYPCNEHIVTAEHLLQYCQVNDALRRDMWPEAIAHRDRLHGNLEAEEDSQFRGDDGHLRLACDDKKKIRDVTTFNSWTTQF